MRRKNNNKWTVKSRDCHIKCKGTITAHAIGIKWRDPTNKPQLFNFRTDDESLRDPSPSRTVPAYGTLVGGGAKVTELDGRGANMLTSSYPKVTPTGTRWFARSAEAPHHRRKAMVTAYAIGLKVKIGDELQDFPSYQHWPIAAANAVVVADPVAAAATTAIIEGAGV